MTQRARSVLDEALRLNLKERARLIADLLSSFDGNPLEATDPSEIEARADRALSGKSAGTRWETVKRRIAKRA
jgi:putative addiction module component (TIGR02574 family)